MLFDELRNVNKYNKFNDIASPGWSNTLQRTTIFMTDGTWLFALDRAKIFTPVRVCGSPFSTKGAARFNGNAHFFVLLRRMCGRIIDRWRTFVSHLQNSQRPNYNCEIEMHRRFEMNHWARSMYRLLVVPLLAFKTELAIITSSLGIIICSNWNTYQ